ncbi:hypothetical protein OG563_41215 [Nocardia vinacea]|uniref:Uncharacterized protein n=1 Tax=Nocardia vinacea TaxID=96468 RepID=A0ABZ1YQI8_9NOCA|nr:hypothetical protein [Nocardia vinacea]
MIERRRVDPITIGEKAASLDIRLEDKWIPAVLYAWARIRLGRDPEWYADVAIDYRNKQVELHLIHHSACCEFGVCPGWGCWIAHWMMCRLPWTSTPGM